MGKRKEPSDTTQEWGRQAVCRKLAFSDEDNDPHREHNIQSKSAEVKHESFQNSLPATQAASAGFKAQAPRHGQDARAEPKGYESEPGSPRGQPLVGTLPEPAGDLVALLLPMPHKELSTVAVKLERCTDTQQAASPGPAIGALPQGQAARAAFSWRAK